MKSLILTFLLLAVAGCDLSIDAISGYEPQSPSASSEDDVDSGDDGSDGLAYVRITNNYSSPLHTVYISSCSSSTWGGDQLSSTIGRGSSQTFGGYSPGCYDLRVDALDGETFTSMNRQLSSGTNSLGVN